MKMRQIYVSVFNEGLWYPGDCTHKLYICKMMSYPILTSILKNTCLRFGVWCVKEAEKRDLGCFHLPVIIQALFTEFLFGSVGSITKSMVTTSLEQCILKKFVVIKHGTIFIKTLTQAFYFIQCRFYCGTDEHKLLIFLFNL